MCEVSRKCCSWLPLIVGLSQPGAECLQLFSDTQKKSVRTGNHSTVKLSHPSFHSCTEGLKATKHKAANLQAIAFSFFFYNRYWPVHKDLLMSALCAECTNFKRGKFSPVLQWKKAAEYFKENKLCDISWTWFLWLIGPSGLRWAYERETQERICQLMILSFSNYV